MDYNFHTHTKRCGHATGEMEDYVKRAIENGIKHMGFSDHVPYKFPGGTESAYRVPTALAGDYVNEALMLREKYKNEIKISVGFEMEYYPGYFEDMLEKAAAYGGEYLILGQHFTDAECYGGKYVGAPSDDEALLKKYTDLVTGAIESGVFTYVAHPDVFTFTGDTAFYRNEAERICEASKKYNVPLEINFLGIRDERAYPKAEFWQAAGSVGCPVTFGFDAHDAEAAYDGESLKKAQRMVKKFGLNYIGEPELIKIKK